MKGNLSAFLRLILAIFSLSAETFLFKLFENGRVNTSGSKIVNYKYG